MRFKALVGAALFAAMLGLTPTVQAAAAEPYSIVSPMYEDNTNVQSIAAISGTKATCRSSCDRDDAVKIVAEQYLQKQGFLWIWSTYDNAEWTKTVYANTLTMSNTKSGLSSGKYRLKTVFKLTDKQGKTETITVYSDEKSV